MHTKRFLSVVATLVVAVAMGTVHAQSTVFHYSYSTDNALPTIVDQSAAGNNATAGPLAVLSTDVPTIGVPAGSGNASFDSSDATAAQDNQAGAATDAVSLLTNAAIEAAGGFTYETWFKWNGAGAVNSIIDYAGTDKLIIDVRDGASTTLAMRMDPNDLAIGEVNANEWNYVAFVFDTTGNTVVDGAITGQATGYLNSLAPVDLGEATKSSFGDSLARSIGIGQHPIGFPLDYFDGSVYETKVSLGALGPNELQFVPEPGSLLMLVSGMLLLSMWRRR